MSKRKFTDEMILKKGEDVYEPPHILDVPEMVSCILDCIDFKHIDPVTYKALTELNDITKQLVPQRLVFLSYAYRGETFASCNTSYLKHLEIRNEFANVRMFTDLSKLETLSIKIIVENESNYDEIINFININDINVNKTKCSIWCFAPRESPDAYLKLGHFYEKFNVLIFKFDDPKSHCEEINRLWEVAKKSSSKLENYGNLAFEVYIKYVKSKFSKNSQ
jgi:hypothetical protein